MAALYIMTMEQLKFPEQIRTKIILLVVQAELYIIMTALLIFPEPILLVKIYQTATAGQFITEPAH